MPLNIGTAEVGAYNNAGRRLVIAIGDTVIDSGIAGNEQVIQLPASAYFEANQIGFGNGASWRISSGRPAIDDALKQNASDNRFLARMYLIKSSGDTGQLWISFDNAASGRDDNNRDLSTRFETQGQVVVETGGDKITVNMADVSDVTDEYRSANITGLGTTIDRIVARSGNQSATLTLRDYEA